MLDRKVYIDESGDENLNLSTGASRFYVLASIVVSSEYDEDFNSGVEALRRRHFQSGEIKSSKIGSNVKRRLRILREARRDLPPYSVVAYRVRKDQVVTSSGLKFPVSFIKFFSSDFCRYLPHSGVAEVNFDAKGRQGFKESFCKYLESKFPPDGLFSKKSFKFVDSKDCLGVQLADLYAGSVAKISEAVGESNDLVTEVFSNTLLFEVPRPRIIGRFIGSDSDAHDLAVRKEALAIAYSAIESQGDDEWALLRVEFLKILVSKLAVGDFDFVGSAEIERILSVATGQSVTSMQLRKV